MPEPKMPEKPSADEGANRPIDGVKRPCPKKRVIVIDPGHGGTKKESGSDPNHAVAVSGKKEKVLTLEFARSLRAALEGPEVEAILGGKDCRDLEVILTRDEDVNLAGSKRVAVATKNKADILVSLHFNGDDNRSVHGTEVFYKDASNAAQSNPKEDKALATLVNEALYGALKQLDGASKNRGVKPDTLTLPKSLAVLADPGIGLSGKMCRSIIVEVEYISNVRVDKLLVSGPDAEKNRDTAMLAVAKALAKAV